VCTLEASKPRPELAPVTITTQPASDFCMQLQIHQKSSWGRPGGVTKVESQGAGVAINEGFPTCCQSALLLYHTRPW
jgi:hypothetical protein